MRRRDYIAGGIGLAAVVAGGAYVTYAGGGPEAVAPRSVPLLEVEGSPSGELTVPTPGTYTVLDLFSYTCLACPPQMDNLRQAKATLGEEAQFVSLHPVSLLDDPAEPDPVFDFWAKHGGPWAVGLDPEDHFHGVFENPNHPYTVVIDPDGGVVWAEDGKTSPQAIVDAVREDTS